MLSVTKKSINSHKVNGERHDFQNMSFMIAPQYVALVRSFVEFKDFVRKGPTVSSIQNIENQQWTGLILKGILPAKEEAPRFLHLPQMQSLISSEAFHEGPKLQHTPHCRWCN